MSKTAAEVLRVATEFELRETQAAIGPEAVGWEIRTVSTMRASSATHPAKRSEQLLFTGTGPGQLGA